MPKGVSSAAARKQVESNIRRDGEQIHTVRPLYELESTVRLRMAELFFDREVEVEVWPNREKHDADNRTYRGLVVSIAFNANWSRGTGILVLEFPPAPPGGQTQRDLPIPMSQIYRIATVA